MSSYAKMAQKKQHKPDETDHSLLKRLKMIHRPHRLSPEQTRNSSIRDAETFLNKAKDAKWVKSLGQETVQTIFNFNQPYLFTE